MNKITGTIIESGSRTIAADGVPIPNVVVKTTWEQLKAWHGAIYGCDVIIESTERHDAREEGIEQLCEQIGRLRDAERQRVAEGMSRWCKPPQSPHLEAIDAALEHAKRLVDCSDYLYSFRRELEHEKRTNSTCATTILKCEELEAEEAFMQGGYEHALDELAQCGAVVVRMMEAVQALVDEAGKAGKGAK